MFSEIVDDLKLTRVPKETSTYQYLLDEVTKRGTDSMAIVDASALKKNYDLWKKELPMVRPHYAVKCNNHPIILKVLHRLGTGFDCASPAEMHRALEAGCTPKDIIYANPQKPEDSIIACYKLGVNTFTFDSEAELRKMIKCTPEGMRGQFVLRLLPPDESHSVCKFGVKFGANPFEAERLVRLALELKKSNDCFDLMGVSFHVGSGCFCTDSFKLAVEYAGRVAKLAKDLGHPMNLLDIGGGYMTAPSMRHYLSHEASEGTQVTFEDTAAALRAAFKGIEQYFENMHMIAEPGRFFAGDCMSLAIKVFGRRILFDYTGKTVEDVVKQPLTEDELIKAGNKISEIKYYVGDGMYGWFNSIVFDHVTPDLKYYRNGKAVGEEKKYVSHIFGPTCDSMDCIAQNKEVPLLQIGDYVMCEAFGAYTQAAATEFNGIPLVPIVGIYQE